MVDARQRLAQVYMQQERLDDSVYQLNAALRVDPQDADSHTEIGQVYLLKKNMTSAREAFRRAIQLKGDDASAKARLGLAEACIESSQLAEAEEALGKVPAKEQAKSRLHKLWGDLYMKKGLRKEALEEYKAAELMASEEKKAPSVKETAVLPADDEDEQWEKLLTERRDAAMRALTERQAKARAKRAGGA
jgi:Tfp pilus assembly protein PilF